MTRYIDTLASEQRKQYPMCTGFVDYFPDAMAAVSHVSWLGNEKHNPGQPLHHARGKSMDHADCDVRHQSTRHDIDPAYAEDALADVFHLAEHAWRAMAQLQEAMERRFSLTLAPAARIAEAPPLGLAKPSDEPAPPLGAADPPAAPCGALDAASGVRCVRLTGHVGLHCGPGPAPVKWLELPRHG